MFGGGGLAAFDQGIKDLQLGFVLLLDEWSETYARFGLSFGAGVASLVFSFSQDTGCPGFGLLG